MSASDSQAALGVMPVTSPATPPPLPPKPPVEGECCGRGCEYCVWVYYDQALRRYEAALARGRERYGGPS
jgi:hypothetical protein